MDSITELSRYLIPALWLIWIAGWWIAARDVKPAHWQETRREALVNHGPLVLGMMLMMVPVPGLSQHLLPAGPAVPFAALVLTALGLAFACWARWHLGGNWSAGVTVKEGHTLIRSGPYRWVRHPIYTGIDLALLGSALLLGSPRGFLGAALIMLSFVIKLRAEEARMRETFADYDAYSRRTARLIPGVY